MQTTRTACIAGNAVIPNSRNDSLRDVNTVNRYIAILIALVSMSAVASAHTDMPCPEPGEGFGLHIADMAPECPMDDGRMFGDMVSDMARGIMCCPAHL